MCNLSKGVREKGIAEGMARGMAAGRADGILSSIKSLTETMNLSIDQAMAALKVPEAERQTYLDLLQKQ